MSFFKNASTISELMISVSRYRDITEKAKSNNHKSNHIFGFILISIFSIFMSFIRYFGFKTNEFFPDFIFPIEISGADCLRWECSFVYIQIVYNVFTNAFLTLPILVTDIMLLYKIKNLSNKRLSRSSKSSTVLKLKTKVKKEEKLSKIIITNGIFLVIVRLPDILSLGYYFLIQPFKPNSDVIFCVSYFECSKIGDAFEFLFPLDGIFQFILFNSLNVIFHQKVKQVLNLR